jgi:5-methylcytosine-specific restriction endonuclease McrA
VASPKQWQAIIAAKLGPCRLCVVAATNGGYTSSPKPIEFHHLVSRAQGGDDCEDNVVPLCPSDHGYVTGRDPAALRALAESLTDSEYAYVVGKLGESGPARLFGVGR